MAAPHDTNNHTRPILITGAGGFIGSAVVRLLCRRGYPVRALIHNPRHAAVLTMLPAELITGDILDVPLIDRSIAGTGAVVHCAAIIRAGDRGQYRRVNVDGTQIIIRACEAHGVKRVIFMSTPQVTVGIPTAYAESKRAAEEALRKSSLAWTIFRPVLVYGPGDRKDLTLMARVAFRWPLIPVIGNGRRLIQPVYVDDVAEAMARALEKDVSIRKIYEIAGARPLMLNDFVDTAARVAGKRCVKVHIPIGVAMLVGLLLEKFQRAPLVTREVIRGIGADKLADGAQLSRDLGVTPMGVDEGLKKLYRSLCVPERHAR